MNSSADTKQKHSSQTPILLSAVVCPGAGQLAQKRWLIGLFFTVGFLIGFIWMLLVATGIMIDACKFVVEPDTCDVTTLNAVAILPPFGIAILFYLLSLYDVWAFARRQPRGCEQ